MAALNEGEARSHRPQGIDGAVVLFGDMESLRVRERS